MPYTKAFIKETFRLFPNGTEVSRRTEEPMVLSGFSVPAGTHVDLNPTVHFRDPVREWNILFLSGKACSVNHPILGIQNTSGGFYSHRLFKTRFSL